MSDEEEKRFTQDEVNEIVQKRLERATNKAEEERQAASALVEQNTLATEKKWQELASVHEKRAKELEHFEAQVKVYHEMFEGMLKDRVKTLGEAAKKAVAGLPGSPTDLEKLTWLNANVASFEVASSVTGTPATRKRAPSKTNKGRDQHRPVRL